MTLERGRPKYWFAASLGRWRAWAIITVLLIIVAVVLQHADRKPVPPPPSVNTAGFDPLIAASIAQAREAVQKAPRSAEARGRMGMVLLAHEVRAQAAECFAQASALAPDEVRWPYFLGLAQLVDNPMAAVTNLERTVRMLAADQTPPRLRLAETLLTLGRIDLAEIHYREVLQREPNSAPARLGLARVANARGQASQAAELLNGIKDDPSTRKAAHRLLLNVYQRLGQTNEAAQIARVLARLPHDAPWPDPLLSEVQQLRTGEAAWIDLADEWIKAGRSAEAARLLEKTLAAYPKSDRAMFFLGRARLRLGDAAGAEQVLLRATELAPGSVEAQVQLGVIQLSRGRPQDAKRAFRAAIQAKPNLAEAWFNLGLSLGNESHTESIAAFREAIRLKPDFPEAYLGLALVLRADGNRPAAVDELKRGLALSPEEPLRQRILQQLASLTSSQP